MAWSGGTFTRVDGTTGWQDDEAAGTGIEAGLMDTAFNDLATDGINQTINKAGQNTPTANLPMGGFKHTGVANASANDEYTTQGQLKDGSFRPKFLNPEYVGTITNFINTNLYSNGAMAFVNRSLASRGAVGVDAAVAANDLLERRQYNAYTGSDYKEACRVDTTCVITPSPGDNAIATRYSIAVGNAAGTGLVTSLIVTDSFIASQPVYNNTTGSAANMFVSGSGIFYRSTSSLRYKENIQPLTHGLEAVKQLKPITFTEKNSDSGEVFAGLIAEDLDEQGLKEFVAYDEEGKPDAIHYGNLVALAFKAIQELEAKVASLEAQLAGS